MQAALWVFDCLRQCEATHGNSNGDLATIAAVAVAVAVAVAMKAWRSNELAMQP
ncbi:hypothetical protein [Lysobacter sp. ESA13C]|uniref:hypothetical protein n=1 Tax=Lysobacter sp. ESA13C TaxID=2862676 RepID=UPI001CBB6E8B|nr:hypothetical protein [Lysobacter sp. ESA13C]